MKNNYFIVFMLGVAWTLTCVYIFLNWEDITRTGWQLPKVFVVIFGLASIGSVLSYLTLQVAIQPNTPTYKKDETKQTSTETETEELVELPPYRSLRAIYKNKAL